MKKGMFCAALLAASSANAGVYGDDMSRCLVEKTTKEERISLVRWMFVAASAHPAVADIASVGADELDKSNMVLGELMTTLLTDRCKEQTKKAIKYEGPAAIQLGFQVLGQVAGSDLFASPEVAKGMAGLEKHVDKQKLEMLVKQE
ncbi:MAG TPA: hypothetical protein VNA21_02060 [Steroidobacteraceae bacterium]|nr:hypothetical protein [Steroidobacteraceae bacterium]